MKVVWKGDIRLLVEGKFERVAGSDKFDKIWQTFLRIRYKIKELDSIKLETDHGNETYSSTRIFFM